MSENDIAWLHGCMDTIRFVIFFIFLSSHLPYLPIFLLLDPPKKLLIKGGHSLQPERFYKQTMTAFVFLFVILDIVICIL